MDLGIGSLSFLLIVVVVGYIWLWLENTEAAMRLTVGIFKIGYVILKAIATVLANIVSGIANWATKRRK
jgi:hypothetical protein